MRSLLSTAALLALTTAFFACATGELAEDELGDEPSLTGSGGSQASSTSGPSTTTSGPGTTTSGGTGGKDASGSGGAGGGKDGTASAVASTSGSGGATTISTAASSGSGGSAPMAWACNTSYYAANDGCDCGCGVPDPDCLDLTVGSCDYCTDLGSCGLESCPGNIDPNNNAACVPVICGDSNVGPGEQCDDGNTVNGDGCDSMCQIEVPMAWTCNTLYYAGQDGCDCGCGVVDPDCLDSTAASCDYCQITGSCGNGTCPANINPNDNAVCI